MLSREVKEHKIASQTAEDAA